MAANTKPKPARLGRGLSSLMGHPPVSIVPPPPPPSPPSHPSSPSPPSSPSDSPPLSSIDHASHAARATEGIAGDAVSTTVTSDLATIATNVHSLSSKASETSMETHDAAGRILFVPIDAIQPNPNQPRQTFDATALQGLADSIKADGVMQPIILRPHPLSSPTTSDVSVLGGKGGGGGGYELIAGERRWRAAQLAGLNHIPAIVRELDDRQSAQWALVENLQRQDLNPMERAHAFSRLAEQFSLSHEQIAQQVGVDRSTITNSLRLLALSKDVQAWVSEGLLSNGHAKALAGVNDVHNQSALATQAIRAQWSVRQLELAVKNAASTTAAAPSPAMKTRQSHFQDLEEQIGQQLQTKVHLRAGRRKGAGALVIEFYTLEQFDSLLARLDVKTEI